MKIKTILHIADVERADDCTITEEINELLETYKITDENLVDIKFSTQERTVPDIDNEDRIPSIDGYIYKIAILVIYKSKE